MSIGERAALPQHSITPGAPERKPSGMERWLPKYAQDTDRPYDGAPWDRQPEESAKSYAAFCIYRDMEPDERSIEKTNRIYVESNGLSPKSNTAFTWSRKHRWVERVEAHDAYLAAKVRARLERKKLKAAERHADDAQAAQSIAMLPINELRKRLAEQGGQLGTISDMEDGDLVKLYKAMVGDLPVMQRAEREALDSGSGGGTPIDHARIKAKGQTLRAILADKTMLQMVEAVTLELDEPTNP